MFEGLSGRLGDVFDRLRRSAILSEEDVAAAMREVRIALIEADVSLSVVKSFIRRTQRRCVGQVVMSSVSPSDMVVKIVHDELIALLADEGDADLAIDRRTGCILMVGLQGSGKTTTTAKIARHLQKKGGKRVLMASLDTRRPAAMEQLAVLGRQIEVDTVPIIEGLSPVDIARRAQAMVVAGNFDICLLDTAGRLHVDDELMAEIEVVRDITSPREILLVVDGLTGQDAVNVAEEFERTVGISGVVLTRMDGDGRGGAALSMRAVTGKPIKFIGIGEKVEDLDQFDANRIAGRILGMGDIVALVERAAETLDKERLERSVKRMSQGRFNMNDLKNQFESIKKMGGVGALLAMMPTMREQVLDPDRDASTDLRIKRDIGLINAMTRLERANPHLIRGSRRQRIAAGAGQTVEDVGRLLKMHAMMGKQVKQMSKAGKLKTLLQMQQSGDMQGLASGMPDLSGGTRSNAFNAQLKFGSMQRRRG